MTATIIRKLGINPWNVIEERGGKIIAISYEEDGPILSVGQEVKSNGRFFRADLKCKIIEILEPNKEGRTSDIISVKTSSGVFTHLKPKEIKLEESSNR